jgi:hypothetical protein
MQKAVEKKNESRDDGSPPTSTTTIKRIKFPTMVVEPHLLEEELLEKILDGFYEVYCAGYEYTRGNYSREQCTPMMFPPGSPTPDHLYLQVLQNEEGKIVGAGNVAVYLLESHSEDLNFGKLIVLRMKNVVHPDYRGQGRFPEFTNYVFHQMSLLYPSLPIVHFARVLHPHGFMMFHTIAGEHSHIYPDVKKNTQPNENIANFIRFLKPKYGFLEKDSNNPSLFTAAPIAYTHRPPIIEPVKKDLYDKNPIVKMFFQISGEENDRNLVAASFHNLPADNWFGLPPVKEKNLNYEVITHCKQTKGRWYLAKNQSVDFKPFSSSVRSFHIFSKQIHKCSSPTIGLFPSVVLRALPGLVKQVF